MTSPDPDWAALARLRAVFLEGASAGADYWRSDSDLAAYDATFAQRIGWKWDHVLADLARRGWQPPAGPLTDWGCGSGIAARACLDQWGAAAATVLHCWDRSALAVRFATQRARTKYPGLEVIEGLPAAPGTVLLSHVLTELDPGQLTPLLEWLGAATTILWVEPGTYDASRRLIAVRERLCGAFHVVSPCTHAGPCGMLTPANEPHWCHHFADPPPAVFTDPFWGRFAAFMGIDLRSLPVSWLVLDRRPPPPLPHDTVRIIGRPRVYKAHAALLGCGADGLEAADLMKRDHPDLFRRLRKDDCPSLQSWQRHGRRVTARPWPDPQTGATA